MFGTSAKSATHHASYSTSSADEGLTNHNDVMMMSELRTQCGINFLPRVHHNMSQQQTNTNTSISLPRGNHRVAAFYFHVDTMSHQQQPPSATYYLDTYQLCGAMPTGCPLNLCSAKIGPNESGKFHLCTYVPT
jgi:hypothetical protein